MSAAAEPFWLVLTPSADDAAWREAIQSSVSAAGMVLRDSEREVPGSTDNPAGEVWLTADCDVVASFGRTPTVVIIPRPETAPEAISEKFGIPPPHSVSHASILLARAAAQEPRSTRMILGREIAEFRGKPIPLALGLTIVPPMPKDVEIVRPAVRTALELYASPPVAGREAVWSERIFRYDDPASRRSENIGELDITGRPRILVYGPYLGLPAGHWSVRVRFLVDKVAANHEFRVDWGTSADFATQSIQAPHAGVYEVELHHYWPNTDYGEVRFWLMEGAFDGRMHFLGATLTYGGKRQASAA